MKTKSNKGITIEKDTEKSYVFIDDGKKNIGCLMWHYKKKKWVFNDFQDEVRLTKTKQR